MTGIVHVTGALPLGRGILPLYCLAFGDAAGVDLAPGLRTGRVDLTEGWYPHAQVPALAQAAELTFTTVEGLWTAEQLRKTCPQLIPHESRWVVPGQIFQARRQQAFLARQASTENGQQDNRS